VLAPGYRLARRLDQGSSDEVYLATYPGAPAPVVMKFLRRALDGDPRAARTCRSETARLARVRHPHVAATLALGTTREGIPCVVREYLGGEPLSAHLARRAIPPREAVALVDHLAAALAAVHQAGALHGELRPTRSSSPPRR
jgi:serine/threonine protein kinase